MNEQNYTGQSSAGLMGSNTLARRVGDSPVMPMSEIDQEMKCVASSLEILSAILSQLEDKLSPVCTPSSPKAEAQNKNSNLPRSSKLGQQIQEIDRQVNHRIEYAQDILNRIQL